MLDLHENKLIYRQIDSIYHYFSTEAGILTPIRGILLRIRGAGPGTMHSIRLRAHYSVTPTVLPHYSRARHGLRAYLTLHLGGFASSPDRGVKTER